MKKIELVNGISSSALGFGCSPILGSVDAKTSRRAIECALDCGINHFDLARSYGYGEAENFVGKVIKDRRDAIVLASKFGIKANWKAAILKPVKPLLRTLLKRGKETKANADEHTDVPSRKTVADHFHYRIEMNKGTMRKSLEESLRALGTDYIDYFFVHEPTSTLSRFDELAVEAEKLKQEGKIRAWGLAYMREQEHLHSEYLNKFDILQFNNSPGSSDYDNVLEKYQYKSNIFFSPLRGGSKSLSSSEKLTKLFNDFPKSVVLCSMFNENHLRENANLLKSR